MYPLYVRDILNSDQVTISKLHNEGAVSSDTCNSARKIRQLLVKSIEDAAVLLSVDETIILDIDSWNHLRNVWLGGMAKALSKYLKLHLCEDLEYIDSRLRVTPSIDMILCAVDKEFSLCANYPKGYGKIFYEWIEKNNPGSLLLHVERA